MRFLVSGWIITIVAVLAKLGLKDSPTKTPHAIADLAVREVMSTIFTRRAQPGRWREKIVSSTAADHGSMYVFIARQLTSIRDSELHLVARFELSAYDPCLSTYGCSRSRKQLSAARRVQFAGFRHLHLECRRSGRRSQRPQHQALPVKIPGGDGLASPHFVPPPTRAQRYFPGRARYQGPERSARIRS